MATTNLARRVAALEEELAQVKQRLANGAQPAPVKQPWWEEIWGTFANDPTYDEIVELGRQYRESLRPKTGKARGRKAAKAKVKTKAR